MKLKHFIIEGYCPERKGKKLPCKNSFKMDSYCYFCPKFIYGASPLEIAFSDSGGVVQTMEDWCGFGGRMTPLQNEEYWHGVWKNICQKKIKEANEEYWSYFAHSEDCDF